MIYKLDFKDELRVENLDSQIHKSFHKNSFKNAFLSKYSTK